MNEWIHVCLKYLFLVEDHFTWSSDIGPSVSTTKLQIKLAERVDKDDENECKHVMNSQQIIVAVEQAIGTAMPFQVVLHNLILLKHAEWN